jgi:Family of unknown function (DUF6335)
MTKPTKKNLSNAKHQSNSVDAATKAAKSDRSQSQPVMSPDTADADEETIISDLPQEITESYGTGVHPEPGLNIGMGRKLQDEIRQYTSTSPKLTGGDVDAAWEQADAVGEEAVGGTVATPDQDIVDDLGAAVGTEMRDQQDFYGVDQFNVRDDRRWELDPKSSEDYQERRE